MSDGPIPWERFYDPDEDVEIPEWVEPDRVRAMVDDIRWERAHERAIRVGLLTALAAAEHRWTDYGPHDYLPAVLQELTAQHFPRSRTSASPKNRRPIPAKRRRLVMERDAYRCTHCGSHIDLVIDHVYPVARGGTNDIDNLQTLCASCNTEKGTKTIEELGW